MIEIPCKLAKDCNSTYYIGLMSLLYSDKTVIGSVHYVRSISDSIVYKVTVDQPGRKYLKMYVRNPYIALHYLKSIGYDKPNITLAID